MVTVLNLSGTVIATDDNSGGGVNAQVSVLITSEGWYTVRKTAQAVGTVEPQATQNFELKISSQ